ncbi:MAG TPA: ABC transporter substrate-binding protein [Candidatus Bathyarchaeia archaeon]|nr:ABC transporter substrate-binding protein [Candidatus Bathyarchaeia archaeon]
MNRPSLAVPERRIFMASLAAGVASLGVDSLLLRPAGAQTPARIARVGFLTPSTVSPRGVMPEMRQRLREMGYVEGRDIKFEVRAANDDFERLSDLATDLVESGVDMIIAISSPAIRAAELATSTLPIVMVSGTDPVESLFVASLSHPDGNVTGVTTHIPELAARRLEVLRECIPNLHRVAVLANLRNPGSAADVKATEAAARTMSLDVQVADARLPEQYPAAFDGFVKSRARALMVTIDPVLSSNRDRIVQLAARHRLPAMYEWEQIVDSGGFISYGPSPAEINGLVAVFVDKILKGANPADLPVQRPTRLQLSLNLNTAKSLGVKVPQTVLDRADRVLK